MCYGHRAGCWGYKQTEMRCRPCPQEIHPLVEERVKQVIVTMHAEKVKSRKRGLTRSQIFLYLVLEHVASVTGRKVHFQGTLRPDVSRGPAERNPSLRGGCTSGQEATQQSSKQPWTHRGNLNTQRETRHTHRGKMYEKRAVCKPRSEVAEETKSTDP
ncbi:uncharacterized protein LOC115299173 isoform X4 [Suricata suricatta]|uniref:uncharacterized protein LOC115299173 isoform X4 n=1 Tax=Suricata suricatta TaxID=37032 RepID=UPI001155A9EE|nr:uncharacterized protein LOC115299173 isoform X4 [Suricata suricatta]